MTACDEAQEGCRLGQGGPPFLFFFLIVLRNAPYITSFLHPGGTSEGKKNLNAVQREGML